MVKVTGMPSSGSTFVWQVLGSLGKPAVKSHGFSFKPKKKTFVTYRDPRDIVLSMSRRMKNHPKKGKTFKDDMSVVKAVLQEINKHFKQVENAWHKQGSHNVHLIRYEDFFPNNTAALVDFLAARVGVALTAEECEELAQKHSLQENKKIADQHDNFWSYDHASHIHGDHITGNGEVGGWKEAFSEDVIEFIYQKTKTYCDLFGYKLED